MSYLKILFTVLTTLTLFISCGIISDDPSSGTSISGITITGSNTTASLKLATSNDTKSNVSVYLYKKGKESIVEDSTVTNDNGEFTFENVPFGDYVVMADSKRVCGGIERGIEINNSKRRNDNLKITLNTYVEKIIQVDDISVHSMKYFHFELESVVNDPTKFTLTTLQEYHQEVSVVKTGETTEEIFVVLNIKTEFTISITPASEIVSSSENQSSMIGVSSSEEISSMIGVSSSEEVSSTGVAGNLLAYWKFDGSLVDETNNANGVDVEGNITFVPGVAGPAVSMGAENQSITFDVVDEYFHLQEYTFSGWINLNSVGNGYQDIFGNHRSTTGIREGISFQVNTAGQLLSSYGTGSSWVDATASTTLNTGEWYFVSVTNDRSNLKLFINGALVTSTPLSSIIYHSAPTRIGEAATGLASVSRDFDGLIDELKIYNYAISESELLNEYTVGNRVGTELVIQPDETTGKDTKIVYNGDLANTVHIGRNDGKFDFLVAGGYDPTARQRILIQFPLPTDVSATEVSEAHMVLFRKESWVKHYNIDFKIDAYKMLRDWKQGTSNTDTEGFDNSVFDGATGLEAFYGSSWAAEGVAFDGSDASSQIGTSVVIPGNEIASFDSVSFDVTNVVKEWLNDPSQNFGLLLRNEFDLGNDDYYPDLPGFHSCEALLPEKRPKLILKF